jgi:hypothetical protein
MMADRESGEPPGVDVAIGLHAWSITSITSINPRAADSVKNILQYRHINASAPSLAIQPAAIHDTRVCAADGLSREVPTDGAHCRSIYGKPHF